MTSAPAPAGETVARENLQCGVVVEGARAEYPAVAVRLVRMRTKSGDDGDVRDRDSMRAMA